MQFDAKKILVAVDGSDSAFETVRYVSKTAPFQDMGVVLFHVYSKIPESYWDIEDVNSFGWQVKEVRAWERGHRKAIEEYMEKAKKILWRTGFEKDLVHVDIHDRNKGITRDIIQEAAKGYGCVVIGRRGVSRLRDLVLGSVSTKLTQKMNSTPLIVVGKNPRSHSLLLAVDGSDSAMRAVNSVGALLGGADLEIKIVHVIRGEDKVYVNLAMRRIEPVFEDVKNRLLASGFEPHQVSIKLITGTPSRAGAILKEAREGRHGTIVMGKKGLSVVGVFLMGRVSNKVLHLAKGHAVWLVD